MSTAAANVRAPARLVLHRWQVGALAAVVPAILAGMFVAGNVRASIQQRDLADRFARATPLDVTAWATMSLQPGEPVARLRVEAAGIDVIVVEGGDASRAPAHRPDSARPGLPGVSVIEGARFGNGNPFLNLPRLRIGDPIVLQTRAGTVRYRVTGIATMPAHSVDRGEDSSMPALLLVSPARAWGSRDRLVVRAEVIA